MTINKSLELTSPGDRQPSNPKTIQEATQGYLPLTHEEAVPAQLWLKKFGVIHLASEMRGIIGFNPVTEVWLDTTFHSEYVGTFPSIGILLRDPASEVIGIQRIFIDEYGNTLPSQGSFNYVFLQNNLCINASAFIHLDEYPNEENDDELIIALDIQAALTFKGLPLNEQRQHLQAQKIPPIWALPEQLRYGGIKLPENLFHIYIIADPTRSDITVNIVRELTYIFPNQFDVSTFPIFLKPTKDIELLNRRL